MSRVSGSWNHFGYWDNKWKFVVSDAARFTIDTTGNMSASGDINAVGGHHHSYQMYANAVLQNTVVVMTGSHMSASAGNRVWYTAFPMVASGSVVGLSLKSLDGNVDDSSNGALTGTVVVASTKTTAEVIITTGSWGATTIAKDTTNATFNPGDSVYVVLTASSDYLNSVAASCSWVANIMVES